MNCVESVIEVPKLNELDIKLYITMKGAVPEGADPISDVEPVYALALRKLKYFGNRGSMCVEFKDADCFDTAQLLLEKTSTSMIHNVIAFSNSCEFISEVLSDEKKTSQFKQILSTVNTVLLEIPFVTFEGEKIEEMKAFISLLDSTKVSIRIKYYITKDVNDNEQSLKELFVFLQPYTNIVKVHMLSSEKEEKLNYELGEESNETLERCDEIYKKLMYDENVDYFFYV